jgi:hypothetical protein
MTEREIDGPTPAGGARGVIRFRAADGRPADESEAVSAVVIEYDDEGKVLVRTYARLSSED